MLPKQQNKHKGQQKQHQQRKQQQQLQQQHKTQTKRPQNNWIVASQYNALSTSLTS